MKSNKNISNNDSKEQLIVTNEDLILLNKIKIKHYHQDAIASKVRVRSKVLEKIESINYTVKSERIILMNWKSIAAAVAAILIVCVGAFRYFGTAEKLSQTALAEFRTLNVPNGKVYSVVLADGSKVILNSGSKFIYPTKFGNDTRTVELIGEGIFNVTKNPEKPFIVHSSHMDVKVLGTVFNLKTYADDKKVLLTLAEGKVEATSKSTSVKQQVTITPNQQVELNVEDGKIVISDVDAALYLSWKDGKMYFPKNTLEEISEVLARHYNVQISFKDQSIKDELYFCQFDKKDRIEKILDILSLQSKWNYSKNGSKIILSKQIENK